MATVGNPDRSKRPCFYLTVAFDKASIKQLRPSENAAPNSGERVDVDSESHQERRVTRFYPTQEQQQSFLPIQRLFCPPNLNYDQDVTIYTYIDNGLFITDDPNEKKCFGIHANSDFDGGIPLHSSPHTRGFYCDDHNGPTHISFRTNVDLARTLPVHPQAVCLHEDHFEAGSEFRCTFRGHNTNQLFLTLEVEAPQFPDPDDSQYVGWSQTRPARVSVLPQPPSSMFSSIAASAAASARVANSAFVGTVTGLAADSGRAITEVAGQNCSLS